MELMLGSGHSTEKRITIENGQREWTQLVTLDMDPNVNPSVVHDLNILPLPFDDDMFDEIHAYEVLEHTGSQGDYRFFFNQFYEFWRILKPNGLFMGTVPAWDSIWAWGDPGHTRVITEYTLGFLSQKEYKLQAGKTSMTDYRHMWKGDFDFRGMHYEGDNFGFILQAIK